MTRSEPTKLMKSYYAGEELCTHVKYCLQGMCFCQYVLHREMENPPISVVEVVKGHVTSMKKNAFSKSHRRKTDGSQLYLAPYSNNNGLAQFV